MIRILADENITAIGEACAALGDIELYGGREIPRAALERADALLCRSTVLVDRALLEGTPVSFVATATSGSEHVDREYCADRGIAFANAAGSNALAVAEYVMCSLFSVAAEKGIGLRGISIGIIGAGHVGTWVAELAEALTMKAILNDPPKKERTGDPSLLSLREALQADIVSLHVTLTDGGRWPTRGMADASFFRSLEQGKIFLNTSRGGVVDTSALIDACEEGRFRGVVLDVFAGEPLIDPDILQYCDLATPHIAGYSLDGRLLGTQMVYESLCRHLGKKPEWNYLTLLPAAVPFTPRVESHWRTFEEVVNGILRQIHPLRLHDRALRKTVLLPAGERGAYFDRLRREYPDRREFPAIPIIAKGLPEEAAHALAALGFPVV